MRLAVYVDDVYRREGGIVSTTLAFPLFAAGLAAELEAVTLLGRLDPVPGRAPHRLPPDVRFVPLPHYSRLNDPRAVARGVLGALRRFWRTLGEVDAIWLLGPHPLGLLAAGLAVVRRRTVVLGVRQDTMQYAAHRHPDSRVAQLAFWCLEQLWRRLARVVPVAVVGPELAAIYCRSPRRLELSISFVGQAQIVPADVTAERRYDGEVRVLSVGRLDPEKNPLLLADILAALRARGVDARLVICGDGALRPQLEHRLDALGVADRAELLGYVPVGDGLEDVYRGCHVFLHVSWTEGVPQVLFEAFAARLPTVATAVGGVAGAAGAGALLVPPGDADAAVTAIRRVVEDPTCREQLVAGGLEQVRANAQETQLRRLAAFLRAAADH